MIIIIEVITIKLKKKWINVKVSDCHCIGNLWLPIMEKINERFKTQGKTDSVFIGSASTTSFNISNEFPWCYLTSIYWYIIIYVWNDNLIIVIINIPSDSSILKYMNQPETEDVKSCPSWEAEFIAWKGQYATLIG